MSPQTPKWEDIAKQLLEAKVPDNVYDAQRDAYFQQFVLPAALQSGESPSYARENFMKASERPDRAQYPRAALVGASALKALTSPLKVALDPETARNLDASNRELVNNAAREAQRQGINPKGYQMVGEIAGSVPYFIGGFGAARGAIQASRAAMVARGVSETAAKIATDSIVLGTIQGVYDAAKADEGHRIVEGLEGFGMGAAFGVVGHLAPKTTVGGVTGMLVGDTSGAAIGAGMGGVVDLASYLMRRTRLPKEAADAVAAAAKGTATPLQENLAAQATQATPEMQVSIQEFVAQQVAAAKKAGLPKDAIMAEPGGRVKIQMRTGDGKTYNVGGVTGVEIQNIGSLVDRISPHLDAGGEILSVSGDPQVVRSLLSEFERINTAKGLYDVELPLGAVGEAAGVRVKVPAGGAGGSGSKGAAPSPSSRTTPSESPATPGTAYVGKDSYYFDGEVWAPAKEKGKANWYETETGKALPKKALLAKIEEARTPTPAADPMVAAIPPSEGFEVLPSGMVRDKATGELHINAFQALVSKGVLKPNIEAYPQLSMLPDGRVFNMETGLSYSLLDDAVMALARKSFSRQGGEGGMMMRYSQAMDDVEAYLRKRHPMGQAPPATDKLRPTNYRTIHEFEIPGMGPGVTGATMAPRGSTPRIEYAASDLSPEVVFHETLHGHFGTTGIIQDFRALETVDKPWRKMMYQLTGAWPAEMRASYFRNGAVGEEVYAYLASAIRTNDEVMIKRFIEADGSREQVMKWAAETTDTLLESVSKLSDSVHKRVMERKLREVYRRSTNSLRDITGDTAAVYGVDVDFLNGHYIVRTPEGQLHRFTEKEQLVDFLERNYQEPLSAPNLVDETLLPPDVPRLARKIPPPSVGRKPIETPPHVFAQAEGPGAEKLGGAIASFFFRPFYPWLDTIAKKLDRPDLYDAFKGLDVKMIQRDALIEHYENPLKRALVGKSLFETKYPRARQEDLYMYLQAKPGFEQAAAQRFGIGPREVADVQMLQREVLDPIAAESGVDFLKYLREVAPLIRRTADPDAIKPGFGGLTRREAEFWKQAILKGEIDPFEKDLLRSAHTYIRLTARDKTIGADLDAIKRLIDEKIPQSDDYRLGSLRPLLHRQLEYIKGRPDYTQRLMDGATQGIINLFNKTIEGVNSKLPGNAKIPTIDSVPQDVLGRWILYSYAGGLALRPMVVFRDSMQLFLTTLPMLGPKYLKRGLERAFPAAREGRASDAYRIADQYGALMHQSDLQNLYSGGYEQLQSGSKLIGKVTNFAEWSLKWLQWSNNSNRLVTFWGHAERNLDALRKNVPSQNAKGLVDDAGWFHLDDRLRDNLVREAMGADAGKWQDIAYRAAKEMTDISQWNYRRGASPGFYKYSMGRLFGQYGTWPLNYIEYIRRLVSKGDAKQRMHALTTLAIAHGAVLKTGELFGIDTGSWVFSQPIAYGGSPLFQAVVNLPGTMDFESYRGTEARRELSRIFWPMEVPGGLAAEKIYNAISADSPTALQEALGFQPLKPGETEKGIHRLIP